MALEGVNRHASAPGEGSGFAGVDMSAPSGVGRLHEGRPCRSAVEAKPGGKFRYEWSNGKGERFFITGEFVELDPPRRIVHIERMHLPDPTPDNHIVTTFEVDGEGTLMTMRMSLPDSEARKAMLATGMEHGMEASYARLERVSDWRSGS
jgi:uncharacterized protein YndB with AHSA1/START domain